MNIFIWTFGWLFCGALVLGLTITYGFWGFALSLMMITFLNMGVGLYIYEN